MQTVDHEDDVYDALMTKCLEMYESNDQLSVIDMAMKLMDNEKVPMHHPFHHFIVPAVLLSAVMKVEQIAYEELQTTLTKAIKRSKNVQGGFCGSHGSCGAAIGMGIFVSVFTDTTPMSVDTWAWANMATGLCLLEIAKVPGPRCCKRVVFITLKTAIPFIKDKMNITLPAIEDIHCKYSQRNAECKKVACPFYLGES